MQHQCETDNRNEGGEEIADRSGDGGENVVADEILKITVIDWRGFGISERGKTQKDEHCGQKDCAEQVDVNQRIQGDTAQHLGRWIAKAISHPGMGRFVDADGKQQDHNLKKDDNGVSQHCSLMS